MKKIFFFDHSAVCRVISATSSTGFLVGVVLVKNSDNILCNCNNNVLSSYLTTLRLWSLYVSFSVIIPVHVCLMCFMPTV